MSYGPPSYTDAGGNLTTGYSPPSYTDVGGDVNLGPPILLPIGWASASFGTIVVTKTAVLTPFGLGSGAFGTPTVFNFRTYSGPIGFVATSFGAAQIYNSQQFVVNGGWNSLVFGVPRVFDPLQRVVVPGIDSFKSLAHYVADYYQNILLHGRGVNTSGIGAHFVAARVRYVEPPWLFTGAFGNAVVKVVAVVPDTWRSHVVATGASVTHARRGVDAYGVSSAGAVPWPTVTLANRSLREKGWSSLQFQSPTVYNLRQYVDVIPYTDVESVGLLTATNRNRVLEVSGFVALRMGRRTDTYVENAARAVAPLGWDSTVWGQDTFAAYSVRLVHAASWQSSRFTRWGIVYNSAFLVAPASIGPTSRVGVPDPVLNLRRWITQYGTAEQTVFGTAFVAFRVRAVRPAGIAFPTAFFPVVRWNPQPIRPAGFVGTLLDRPFGYVVITQFLRNARPMSINVHQVPWVGLPRVENRNKELRPQPVVRGDYGRPRVFNKDQYAPAGGDRFSRFGAVVVGYRTRSITFSGVVGFHMPVTHRIRNVLADPPGAQVVEPPSMFIGFIHNPGVVPSPRVWANSLYPEGIDSLRTGTAVVRGNDIRPVSIIFLDKFGVPLVSSTQYVHARSIPLDDRTGLSVVARPQMSPHRIYAPSSDQATAQARANHPINDIPNVIGPERFGVAYVSGTPRYLRPLDWMSARFGQALVDLRTRYVRPVTIRGPRFGPIILLNVPQFVGFDEDTPGYIGSPNVGEHSVSRPPANPHVIEVSSLPPTGYGRANVDLQNRQVAPTGIPHQPNAEQGQHGSPFGIPVVGYPRSYTLTAGDCTLWGTHTIEYLHRQVWPAGWESLTLVDESLGSFQYRMRVTRRNPVNAATGIATTTGVGVPTVSFRVRTLIAHAVWSGYTGMARVSMTIAPTGWEDTVFGDIDEWVPGTVKVHGAEMFGTGYPRLARGVRPPSIGPSVFADPRFARHVQMSGLPPIGFDGPSVTDEYGCSRRVITVWPIQLPVFPQPTVTT